MKIRLIVIISAVLALLLVAVLFILNLTITPQSTSPIQSQGKENTTAPGIQGQLPAKTETPGKTEILPDEKGPFPVDDTVPAKERQIGRLFNIWRKAVLTKNITQINQLDSQIKGCGDEAIPFLTKLAKEDTNERVRAFSVRVLGRMNVAELSSALPSVNPSTYWSAGQLSSLFMELLKNDASAFVRENCCWALGRLGNTDSFGTLTTSTLEILQKVADNDASAQVRKVASEAIANIKPSK